jgi:hypothetical protein
MASRIAELTLEGRRLALALVDDLRNVESYTDRGNREATHACLDAANVTVARLNEIVAALGAQTGLGVVRIIEGGRS